MRSTITKEGEEEEIDDKFPKRKSRGFLLESSPKNSRSPESREESDEFDPPEDPFNQDPEESKMK